MATAKKLESNWQNIETAVRRMRTVFDLIPPPPEPNDQFGHLMNTTHENLTRLHDLAKSQIDQTSMQEEE